MATRSVRIPFPYPSQPPSWHPGHMRSALLRLEAMLSPATKRRRGSPNHFPVDVVIEARDARLPLSSVNPALDRMVKQAAKARVVVYTKKDLADAKLETPITEAFARHGQDVTFTSIKDKASINRLIARCVEHGLPSALKRLGLPPNPPKASGPIGSPSQSEADSDPQSEPEPDLDHDQPRKRRRTSTSLADGKGTPAAGPVAGVCIMVVGMPNVGKSSLLNSLRYAGVSKGKAASTSPEPGHTRGFQGLVRVLDPSPSSRDLPVYVGDSPGVMVPYLGSGEGAVERGLKLGLTAGVKESLFDPFDLANYLFHRLLIRLHANPDFETTLLAGLGLPPSTLIPHYPFAPTAAAQAVDDIGLEPLRTQELLTLVADRLQARRRGGELDLERAVEVVLRGFRDGVYGRWTLDDMEGDDDIVRLDRPLRTGATEKGSVDGDGSHSVDTPAVRAERVQKVVTAFFNSPEGRGELVSHTAAKAAEKARLRQARQSARGH